MLSFTQFLVEARPQPTRSSVQFNLPSALARAVVAVGRTLAPEDILDLELKPHVTILGEISTMRVQNVRHVLRDEPACSMQLGVLAAFELSDVDVLYVAVQSPGFVRMNLKLRQQVLHKNPYPVYTPHATVAYLQPGTAAAYVGGTQCAGMSCLATQLAFCPPYGGQYTIPLQSPSSSPSPS